MTKKTAHRATGLERFWRNLKRLPKNLFSATIRHGAPTSTRTRMQVMFSNFFLHIHSAKINKRSLKSSTTWGLGVSLFAQFLILLISGVVLMIYYVPSIEGAYNSIKDIHYVVPVGRFMRNTHRWAGHLMVITLILHMMRVFYTSAYKKPREFNWLMGIVLFVLTLGLSFTGYLLPWDQLAYWAIVIATNIAASPNELVYALGLPDAFNVGDIIKGLLLGAPTIGQDALTRFYMLHIMVLPLTMVSVMGVHIWRVRKDGGLANPEGNPTPAGRGVGEIKETPTAPIDAPTKSYGLMAVVKDKTPQTGDDTGPHIPAWPYLLRAELLVFMINFFLCVALAYLYDAPLKEVANAAIPENPAKAPWYFLGLQELVSYSAFVGGMVIPGLAVLGLSLIPFLDREKETVGIWFSGERGKRVALWSLLFGAITAILAVAVPVNYGWLRNWYPDIPQLVVILINPGSILTALYMGWSLAIIRKTSSTRMGAIALFTCFIIGFTILTYVGTYLRGPNWDFYWSQRAWPTH